MRSYVIVQVHPAVHTEARLGSDVVSDGLALTEFRRHLDRCVLTGRTRPVLRLIREDRIVATNGTRLIKSVVLSEMAVRPDVPLRAKLAEYLGVPQTVWNRPR